MKKSIRRAMISMLILTLTGAGLCLWVYKSGNYGEEKELFREEQEAQTSEQRTGGPDEGDESRQGEVPGEESESQIREGDQGADGSNPAEIPEGEEPVSEETSLVFTGDIYLSPYVLEQYDREGISGVLSEKLLSEMRQGDVVMANEEFPFSTGGEQAPDKQFTFRINPSYINVLKDLGIHVVTLANNHALDYGPEALTDTFQTLDDAGIAYVGAGMDKARAAKAFFVQNGTKNFGFLGASRVIPVPEWNIENQQPGMLCTYDSALLCEAIRQTKQQCDFLTVYVHWGIERENTPEEYQRQLAKEYIDAGADLIIGAHPHVLQGIEYYNGKPIVYSLGNFIFNQEISSTILLKAVVTPENETFLQIFPAYAAGAKTQEMSNEQAQELYRFLEEISYGIQIGEEGTVRQR